MVTYAARKPPRKASARQHSVHAHIVQNFIPTRLQMSVKPATFVVACKLA